MLLRRVDKLVEGIAVAIFAASTLLICINVINRYFVLGLMRKISAGFDWFTPIYLNVRQGFGSISVTADEVPGLLLVWIAFLGAYLAMRKEGHISFDMLLHRLPRFWHNTFILLNALMICAFVGLLLMQSIRMIYVAGNREIETMEIAQGYFMAIIPIACILFLAATLQRTIKFIRNRMVGSY